MVFCWTGGGGGEELLTLAKELLTLLVELLGDTVLDVDIFCMVRLNRIVKLKTLSSKESGGICIFS